MSRDSDVELVVDGEHVPIEDFEVATPDPEGTFFAEAHCHEGDRNVEREYEGSFTLQFESEKRRDEFLRLFFGGGENPPENVSSK